MPRVCTFHGIRIYMYHRDHWPAHFHVKYGSSQAIVSLETGEILAGLLPHGALRLVQEWAQSRQRELWENWHRARRREPLEAIQPLE